MSNNAEAANAVRTAHLNESMFKLSELLKLHEIFATQGALSEKQFVTHFHAILESDCWTAAQISQLFMKIDANSDGSVDWDEFTNFMFVHSQSAREAADQLASVAYVPHDDYNENDPPLGSHRPRDVLVALHPQTKCGHYVSCTVSGVVTSWNASLQVLSSFQAQLPHKQPPVTILAMAFLPNCGKVAVASVATGVLFFDLVSADKTPHSHVPPSQLDHAAPLALAAASDDDTGDDVLYIGDDTGSVTKLHLTTAWHLCDGDRPCHAEPTIDGGRFSRAPRRHVDHVTRLAFVADLNSIVSASRDGSIKVNLCRLFVVDVHRGALKRSFDYHRGAVYDFVWCPRMKFVASCGVERDVLIWSPFSEGLLGRLHGHSSSVRSVVWNDNGRNLISLGVDDGAIRVWDVRQFKCLQVIHDATHENHQPKLIYFDADSKHLLACSTMINQWPMHHAAGVLHTLQPHEQPITKLLFNASFEQLVSIDSDGHIVLWNVLDGSVISHFFMANTTITASALDDTGRRLITGSNLGTKVNVWNFSNGSLLTTLHKRKHNPYHDAPRPHDPRPTMTTAAKTMQTQPPPARKPASKSNEVTGVAHITASVPHSSGRGFTQTKFILSVGWDRRVYVWHDESTESDYASRMPEDLSTGHTDDILAVVFCAPKFIATGGMDGQVILWGLNSGDAIATFTLDSSVDHLVYPRKVGLVLAITSSATLYFINPRFSFYHATIDLRDAIEREDIRAVRVDTDGLVLVLGLSLGSVCVFELGDVAIAPMKITQRHRWKAHDGEIQSLEYVEASHLLDTFLVTSHRLSMKLWTLTGTLVGSFGETTWRLDDVNIASLKSTHFLDSKVLDNTETVDTVHPHALATYKKELPGLVARGPPAVDDVWSRRDIRGVLIDVITLTSISRGRGALEGLDNHGRVVDIELHALYDIRDDYATWYREEFLSSLVGRVHQESEWTTPFKAARAAFDSTSGWLLVDTGGREHPVPDEAHCKEINYRPMRSLALHVTAPHKKLPRVPRARTDSSSPKTSSGRRLVESGNLPLEMFFAASKFKPIAHCRAKRPTIVREMRTSPTKLSAECAVVRFPTMAMTMAASPPPKKDEWRKKAPLSPRRLIDERKVFALDEATGPPMSARDKTGISFYLPEVDK
ncbi:Aste57867_19431 [Aphanomyces stellatus]|uniref:Aste57867_19431 protein n=1 Tax=Aphanomyces stellatus TaxID=120398 RepID=A0A485LCJ5_9STRA|nr:hypothetical protein As57867_019367 [Aphanomyces stellatus]VFT96145.1 Aste57867_19431 [Aphanomyces stellatus]